MTAIKCTIVGVDETSKNLKIAFARALNKNCEDSISSDYEMTYSVEVTVDEKEYNLGLWDTVGLEADSMERIRIETYAKTDVFILVYSATSKHSFDFIHDVVYPEVQRYATHAPCIVVGQTAFSRIPKEITIEEATTRMGSNCKCRELHTQNEGQLKELFNEAIRTALPTLKSNTPIISKKSSFVMDFATKMGLTGKAH